MAADSRVAAADPEPDPDPEPEPQREPDGETLAADGRRPGRRGRATRQRLLACTASMLSSSSYRELKVVDIAREAGTSPATFYQYFGAVESAVLVLAEEMAAEGHRFGDHVRASSWQGQEGYPAAEALVDEIIGFWEEHRALLRVVDLATDEGDPRFANARNLLLNDLYRALAQVGTEMQPSGAVLSRAEAHATAGVLIAMLVHVSGHRDSFERWGVRTADLRTAMARIVYWSVSGQKPPPTPPPP